MAEHGDAGRYWREAVAGLRTYQREGKRAVHKPLLTLLLLARAERGDDARVVFGEIESPLAQLLRDFGPPRKSVHPEYPFWHLQSDGIWEVEGATGLPRKQGGASPTRGTLLRGDVAGRVPGRLWEVLVRRPRLRAELAQHLLEDYWPESLHDDIRGAVGLRDVATVSARAARDPAFRELVLRAYERACAFCGYDGRLGRDDLALEAAHVRWHCYDGPDELANGLALCSFHHAALDRGALGIAEDRSVLVSSDVHGRSAMVGRLLTDLAGRPVRAPQPGMAAPDEGFARWHRAQVFRGPARGVG